MIVIQLVVILTNNFLISSDTEPLIGEHLFSSYETEIKDHIHFIQQQLLGDFSYKQKISSFD